MHVFPSIPNPVSLSCERVAVISGDRWIMSAPCRSLLVERKIDKRRKQWQFAENSEISRVCSVLRYENRHVATQVSFIFEEVIYLRLFEASSVSTTRRTAARSAGRGWVRGAIRRSLMNHVLPVPVCRVQSFWVTSTSKRGTCARHWIHPATGFFLEPSAGSYLVSQCLT